MGLKKWFVLLVLALGSFGGLASLGANPFLGTDTQVLPPPTNLNQGGPVPQFLVDWQKGFRDETAKLIDQWRTDPGLGVILGILLATFIYGLIHALGPGHRKSVVFSLFLGRQTPLWKPLAAGFLSAGIHALAALVLIFTLSLIESGVAKVLDVDQSSRWIEFISALALITLAAVLLVIKIVSTVLHLGHSHGPEGNTKSVWAVVISTSIVPCPGATMVLLLSIYAGVPWLGVLGVISMSVGMGIVIAAAGFLAWAGQGALFNRLKKHPRRVELVSNILEMVSYGFLLFIGLMLIQW